MVPTMTAHRSSCVHPNSCFRHFVLRSWRALAATVGIVVSLGAGPLADSALATTPQETSTKDSAEKVDKIGLVNVIEISGYLDPAVRDFIYRAVEAAVKDNAQALVLQVNSSGSLLSQSELDQLEERLRNEKRIPIAVWVGGGANPRAYGGAARILAAADVRGLARLAKVGRSTPSTDPNDVLLGKAMNFDEAKKAGAFTIDAPVLPDFVGQLDGLTVNGKVLETAKELSKDANGKPVKQLRGVRFAKMNPLERLFHVATNPSVAYLLFVIALALFVFEFFTGGVGVAAGVGLLAFVMSVAGLGALPTRPVGVGLLLLAILGFSIDIQAGTPRFWTAVGTISLALGSVILFANGVAVPWFVIALVLLMVVLFMVNGMPTMVRTRFATPTIGRESMIGEIGTATSAVSPDGVVSVLGGIWRARTNRATPIASGAEIRVVAIDGLLLEVEPLVGGATSNRH